MEVLLSIVKFVALFALASVGAFLLHMLLVLGLAAITGRKTPEQIRADHNADVIRSQKQRDWERTPAGVKWGRFKDNVETVSAWCLYLGLGVLAVVYAARKFGDWFN